MATYSAFKCEPVDQFQYRRWQFGADEVLQVDFVALKHNVGILGTPPSINPEKRNG